MGRWATLSESVGALEPTSAVVLPPGAGGATAIEREIASQSERLRGLDVYSGLLLSDYSFLSDGIRYTTWHVMPPVRAAVADGSVRFLPIRGSQLSHLFATGRLPLDVAVVHTSPPDSDGRCSLGTSTSYPLTLARLAPTVIAQVNPAMPRVSGEASLHTSEIDWLVEVDEPLGEHPQPAVGTTASAIGDRLAALIPSGTTLQVGIGAIPEALLQSLCASDVRDLRIYGMGVDAIVALDAAGKLRAAGDGRPAVLCAELMGTTALYEYAHENSALEMHPFDTILDPAHMAGFEGFVSVNSAVQVDLMGQANVEHLGGDQLSGVGGGFDFAQGAWLSPGGKSIIAMPSTNRRGDVSRIVARLDPGAPVGVPRHFTHYVVTEQGVADLAGLGLRERAEALIAVAAPQFRDELAGSVG
ncbi:MAG: acetyl-CoA hydrolase/transferase family protein [Acidimicrobiia bacterium]|nr:acetyl-CoA hydrolase/transferase family protein [Acidimicrobiia bacterium]